MSLKLYTAAVRIAFAASLARPLRRQRPRWPCSFMWPMRGSTADRRRSSRNGAEDPTLLAGDEDAARLRRVVATVSLVDVDPFDLATGEAPGVLDGGAQGVAVVGIARQGGGVQHELAAL